MTKPKCQMKPKTQMTKSRRHLGIWILTFRFAQHYEPSHHFWPLCSYGNAGVLRIGAAQPVVHPGLWRVVRAGVGLRVLGGGGNMVHRGSAPVVGRGWFDKLTMSGYLFSTRLKKRGLK